MHQDANVAEIPKLGVCADVMKGPAGTLKAGESPWHICAYGRITKMASLERQRWNQMKGDWSFSKSEPFGLPCMSKAQAHFDASQCLGLSIILSPDSHK